jgi:hypothetical protein
LLSTNTNGALYTDSRLFPVKLHATKKLETIERQYQYALAQCSGTGRALFALGSFCDVKTIQKLRSEMSALKATSTMDAGALQEGRLARTTRWARSVPGDAGEALGKGFRAVGRHVADTVNVGERMSATAAEWRAAKTVGSKVCDGRRLVSLSLCLAVCVCVCVCGSPLGPGWCGLWRTAGPFARSGCSQGRRPCKQRDQ